MGEQLNVLPPEHPHLHHLHHSALDLSMNLSSNCCGSAWSDDDLDLMGNIAAAMESALFIKNPPDASQYCDTEHSYEQYLADYLNADDRYEAMDNHDDLINGAADAIINGDDHNDNHMLNTVGRTIHDHIIDNIKQYDHDSNNVSDLLTFARACLSTSSSDPITKPANYSNNQAAAAAANPVLNHAANQRRRMNSNKKKATTGSTIVSVSSTTAGYKLSDFLGASHRIFKPINIHKNGYSANPAINNRFNLRSSHSSSNLLMANSSSTILKRSASMIMNHGYTGNDSNHNHSNVGHVDQAASAADDVLLQFTTHVESESVRRKQMTRLFHTLRSLLPTTTPQHDRCTIIDEAHKYIQTLERELKGLKKKRFVLETADQLLQSSSSTKACTKDLASNKEASKDHNNKHDHDANHDHNHVSRINKPMLKLVEDMIDNDELMKELEQEAPYIQVLGNYDGDYVTSEADQSKVEDVSSPPLPSSVSISIGCHERKRGLFPTILHLMEQHNLEVISANQSHNNDIVLYAIYAKVCQPCNFAIDPNRLKAELYAHVMVFML